MQSIGESRSRMCKTGYGSDRQWICKGRASKAGDGFANWGDGGVGVEFGKREGCSGPWLGGLFGFGFRGSRCGWLGRGRGAASRKRGDGFAKEGWACDARLSRDVGVGY